MPRPAPTRPPANRSAGERLRADRLQALLSEYEYLREESLRAIDNRITVMNFTFGAISIVLAGLLANSIPRPLAGVVGLFFVPQVAKAALLIWLGEYNRSQRAGRRLKGIEGQINELLGEDGLMAWETGLAQRTGTGHMNYPYRATVALVLGAGYAGTAIGAWLLLGDVDVSTAAFAVALGATVLYALTVEAAFLVYFAMRWREAALGKKESGRGRVGAWRQALRAMFGNPPEGENGTQAAQT